MVARGREGRAEGGEEGEGEGKRGRRVETNMMADLGS